jgi:hypothetical protein
MRCLIMTMAFILASPLGALAGEADIVGVDVTRQQDRRFGFSVAVRHADDGWKHYADKWDVMAPDGTVLGTRILVHPHDNEQPFTRSLSGVQIPAGIDVVWLRAHDSVHGYGGVEKRVSLP